MPAEAACRGRLQPADPDRDVRLHRRRRVPPLDLRPLAAGARLLRRLHHRPHRHAVKQTFGFFNQNLVMEYTPRAGRGRRRQRRLRRLPDPHRDHRAGRHGRRRALVDKFRDRQTRATRWESSTTTSSTTPRSSTGRSSRRTRSAPSSGPSRSDSSPRSSPAAREVPKTLIFAKDDTHADDIVHIVREEFGKGNDFAVKITYKSHRARKPDDADRGVPQLATTRASPSPST